MKLAFNNPPDRRDFLKMVSAGMGALAFHPFYDEPQNLSVGKTAKVGRVAIENISVYKEPWDESQILFQKYRDDLLNIYFEVESEHGPGYNPLWYRIWGGYVHSAHIQIVETRLNEVDYSVGTVPLPGKLGEITVPFTQTYIKTGGEMEPMFRFYYEAVFWVVGVISGGDGRPWYRIKDNRYKVDRLDFYIPAEHMRIIPDSELMPISPDVPGDQKHIEVKIGMQELTAFEYGEPVMKTKVSTGIPSVKVEGKVPTDTPVGSFNIQSKMPSVHMGDGQLTTDPEAYELPGVPWVCYFEPINGVATHGTYWHNNFGTTMSHGCVNMPNDKAKWLYLWSTPRMEGQILETRGYGTRVYVS